MYPYQSIYKKIHLSLSLFLLGGSIFYTSPHAAEPQQIQPNDQRKIFIESLPKATAEDKQIFEKQLKEEKVLVESNHKSLDQNYNSLKIHWITDLKKNKYQHLFTINSNDKIDFWYVYNFYDDVTVKILRGLWVHGYLPTNVKAKYNNTPYHLYYKNYSDQLMPYNDSHDSFFSPNYKNYSKKISHDLYIKPARLILKEEEGQFRNTSSVTIYGLTPEEEVNNLKSLGKFNELTFLPPKDDYTFIYNDIKLKPTEDNFKKLVRNPYTYISNIPFELKMTLNDKGSTITTTLEPPTEYTTEALYQAICNFFIKKEALQLITEYYYRNGSHSSYSIKPHLYFIDKDTEKAIVDPHSKSKPILKNFNHACIAFTKFILVKENGSKIHLSFFDSSWDIDTLDQQIKQRVQQNTTHNEKRVMVLIETKTEYKPFNFEELLKSKKNNQLPYKVFLWGVKIEDIRTYYPIGSINDDEKKEKKINIYDYGDYYDYDYYYPFNIHIIDDEEIVTTKKIWIASSSSQINGEEAIENFIVKDKKSGYGLRKDPNSKVITKLDLKKDTSLYYCKKKEVSIQLINESISIDSNAPEKTLKQAIQDKTGKDNIKILHAGTGAPIVDSDKVKDAKHYNLWGLAQETSFKLTFKRYDKVVTTKQKNFDINNPTQVIWEEIIKENPYSKKKIMSMEVKLKNKDECVPFMYSQESIEKFLMYKDTEIIIHIKPINTRAIKIWSSILALFLTASGVMVYYMIKKKREDMGPIEKSPSSNLSMETSKKTKKKA